MYSKFSRLTKAPVVNVQLAVIVQMAVILLVITALLSGCIGTSSQVQQYEAMLLPLLGFVRIADSRRGRPRRRLDHWR